MPHASALAAAACGIGSVFRVRWTTHSTSQNVAVPGDLPFYPRTSETRPACPSRCRPKARNEKVGRVVSGAGAMPALKFPCRSRQGGRWHEADDAAATWTGAAARTKAKLERRLSRSCRAVAVLDEAREMETSARLPVGPKSRVSGKPSRRASGRLGGFAAIEGG